MPVVIITACWLFTGQTPFYFVEDSGTSQDSLDLPTLDLPVHDPLATDLPQDNINTGKKEIWFPKNAKRQYSKIFYFEW